MITAHLYRTLESHLEASWPAPPTRAAAKGSPLLNGDPAAFLVDQTATREEVAAVQRQLGLDQPWLVQYLDFLAAVPRGDFGTPIRERRPAMIMVFQHFWPATVELAAAAIVLSTASPSPSASCRPRGRAALRTTRAASPRCSFSPCRASGSG